ncbi:MAG: gephyrin-like molybdotransferase Glp [Polyangiaceae bacterium]
MLPFAEARARLVALARALPGERVALERAFGRVLSEDVRATTDLPRVTHSTMDGYALRIDDLGAGVDGAFALPVIGESRAGLSPNPLAPASAMRIFTGAALPDGADAVLPQEDTTRDGDTLRFARAPAKGASIRHVGDDLRAGAVAIPAGTRLTASPFALALALDVVTVMVARAPRVTLVATGDELRAAGDTVGATAASLPDCLCPALARVLEREGAHVVVAPFVPDDRERTERALDDALASSDLVVTIGGASVGDHDLVKPALTAVGATIDFWRVAIKPGKPLLVGTRGHTIVLGLPGNPASALVTFALFGIPLVRTLAGAKDASPLTFRATLTRAIRHAAGRTEFVRARLERGDTGPRVTPLANQASGAVLSMSDADALVIVDQARGDLSEGEVVDVLPYAGIGLS